MSIRPAQHPLVGVGQQCSLPGDDGTVVDPAVREPGRIDLVEQAIVDEAFRADEMRVAGEGGERLIRAVTVSGRSEREQLPDTASGTIQELEPAVGTRPEVADAVRPGEAGRVQEDAAVSGHGPAGYPPAATCR